MTNQAIPNQLMPDPRYSACPRVQKMQDLLLVSSFGLWAAVLGLSPVLAFHMLLAS